MYLYLFQHCSQAAQARTASLPRPRPRRQCRPRGSRSRPVRQVDFYVFVHENPASVIFRHMYQVLLLFMFRSHLRLQQVTALFPFLSFHFSNIACPRYICSSISLFLTLTLSTDTPSTCGCQERIG